MKGNVPLYFCGEISCKTDTFKTYSNCFSVKCCSKQFQKPHWNNHKTICLSIKELLHQNTVSHTQSINESSSVCYLTPKQTSKLAKLVGKRCLIICKLNGRNTNTEALFDTGAHTTSQSWLENNLPKTKVKNIAELIDSGVDFKAANGTNTQYVGWVAIDFAMALGENHDNLVARFLFTSIKFDNPIIGYNVIEEVIKTNVFSCANTINASLVKRVMAKFCKSSTADIPAFINFVFENALSNDDWRSLKTSKTSQIIPKGKQ